MIYLGGVIARGYFSCEKETYSRRVWVFFLNYMHVEIVINFEAI